MWYLPSIYIPFLDTHSWIRMLLLLWDLAFWAVWAAWALMIYFLILLMCPTFSNFSCMFISPNYFLQYEFQLFQWKYIWETSSGLKYCSDLSLFEFDSPKKWMKELVLFAFLLFTANKTNSSVHFLVESTSCPKCFWFYLTFSDLKKFANKISEHFWKKN